MKREILFRGKSKSTGEWFLDNLFDKDNRGRTHITTTTRGCLDVDTETAGQCIGISDKHGIEIFEDDIVKYFEPHSKTWHTRIVRWDWRFAGFGLFDKESEWCKESDWLKIKDIEVVGNIYDNKELLP